MTPIEAIETIKSDLGAELKVLLMTYDQLKTGDAFQFEPDVCAWEYRGNGFFSRPWSGGPYYIDEPKRPTTIVILLPGELGRCPECGALTGAGGCCVANNTTACAFRCECREAVSL